MCALLSRVCAVVCEQVLTFVPAPSRYITCFPVNLTYKVYLYKYLCVLYFCCLCSNCYHMYHSLLHYVGKVVNGVCLAWVRTHSVGT